MLDNCIFTPTPLLRERGGTICGKKGLLIFQTVHGLASSLLAGKGHLRVPSSAQIGHSEPAANLTPSASDHLKKIPFIWGLAKNFFNWLCSQVSNFKELR